MKDIVFVKYGSFSHVNAKIADLLREQFPENRLVVLDVAEDILPDYPVESLFLRLLGFVLNPVTFIRGRHSQWDFVFRFVATWRLVSRWIARHLRPENTLFVFQTQSVFDASHPDVPFFIYTDHTHRAHKRQPGGGSPAKVGGGWVEHEQSLYRRADTVFTLSRFCAESVAEDYGVPEEKVLVASTGINIALPAEISHPAADKPVILFVGGEWKIKGGPELLAAFHAVKEKIPACELWLVGSRPQDLPDGVKALGRVPPAQLAELFRKAALLCVPSKIERASMVALDAAAYGIPVITTPHGAGAERIRDGVTGFLVDPSDTAAFSSAILRVLGDPALAASMGRAGRKMVEEEFTWQAVGVRIGGRIRSILPSGRKSQNP
ncbi:MAG: glycosyltransferase family 4 protein [Terrimicrobiaceae bacterium]